MYVGWVGYQGLKLSRSMRRLVLFVDISITKLQERSGLTEHEPQLQLEAQSPLQEPQVLQSLSIHVSWGWFLRHARWPSGCSPLARRHQPNTRARAQGWVDFGATYQGDMIDITGWKRKAKVDW